MQNKVTALLDGNKQLKVQASNDLTKSHTKFTGPKLHTHTRKQQQKHRLAGKKINEYFHSTM